MPAEFAHQKADKYLCVALHRKVRIRLHPSYESICGKQREKMRTMIVIVCMKLMVSVVSYVKAKLGL